MAKGNKKVGASTAGIKEKDIENMILDYLSHMPGVWWKNQSTGVYDPKRKVFRKSRNRHHRNGVSDILGILHGRFIAIEVKTPKTRNKVSEAQKLFIEEINKNGGLAFVACSIEEVGENLREMIVH